jgi:hypothetical protein
MGRVRFDAPGTEFDNIILNNAASEDTLKDLIAAVEGKSRRDNNNNNNLDNSSGKASSALAKVAKVGALVGQAFDAVVTGAAGVVAGLATYTKEQKKTSAALRDMADLLPGSTSKLARSFADTAELFQDNFLAFRKLSGTGLTLGDRIIDLTTDFTTLGIDLDKLTTQLAANSEGIVRIGSGARGVGLALDESKRFINEYGTDLQRFGYGFDEANEKFFTFLTLNSLALRKNASEMTTLSQRGAEYAKYLRQYSDLTGQQADQLEDQMKKQQLDAIFDNFISSINDPQERDRIRNAVAAAGALMQDGGRELAMATAMGIQPQTEASRSLAGVNLGFADQITNSVNMARTFNGSISDYNKAVLTGYVNTNNANQDFLQRFNQTGFAISQQGGPLADTFMGIYRANQLLGKSQGDLEEVFRAGEERVGDAAEGFIQLDDSMRLLRMGMSDLYDNVFGDPAFQEGFKNFANEVKGFARKAGSGAFSGSESDDIASSGATDVNSGVIDTIVSDFLEGFSKSIGGGELPSGGELMDLIENGILSDSGGGAQFIKSIKEGLKKKALASGTELSNEQLSQATLQALKEYLADPNVRDVIFDSARKLGKPIINQQIDGVTKNEQVIGKIKEYNKGTLGFGKLFENFGDGTLAKLHGEEAVIPKKSPLGGMLDMMQGDLGNLKQNMFTADGKMNVSGMMEAGQAMGAKYDAYAKENQGAIKEQGRGLVKSMTNLTDADLDKMEQSSVKSNTTAKSSTSVNTMSGNKMDELIRINKQMLQELRSM